MMNHFNRLLRLLVGKLNRIIGQCVVERRLQPRRATGSNRRAFLRTAPGLLGLGCAAATVSANASDTAGDTRSSSQRWEELSATELVEALRQTSLVYVPIGTLEFHGPHLPLGMDAIHAHEFCLAAAEQTGGVVMPPVYWSPHGHEGWPGSVLVREETFQSLMTDIFTLVAKQGVKLMVASTGHYPAKQEPAIRKIAKDVIQQFPETRILVLGPWCHPTDPSADHGGKKETSLMLSLRPNLVQMERLAGEDAMRGIGASAVDGTSGFGRAYFEAALRNFVKRVDEARETAP